jgi:hypothetical protein
MVGLAFRRALHNDIKHNTVRASVSPRRLGRADDLPDTQGLDAAPANAATAAVGHTSYTNTVDLESAGDYVIFSKNGISPVPASVITGNAVSPITKSAITGFELVMDPLEHYSSASQGMGKV